MLVIFAVSIYNYFTDKAFLEEYSKEHIVKYSNNLTRDFEHYVEHIDLSMELLSKTPFIEGFNSNKCNRLYAAILPELEGMLNIGLLDADGNAICSAIPFTESVNASERDYFQDAIKTKHLAMSDFLIGKITNKPGFNFGYPNYDEEGKLRAVMWAILDVNYFTDLVDNDAFLPQSSFYLIAKDKNVVTLHSPEQEKEKTLDNSIKEQVLSEDKPEGYIEKGSSLNKTIYVYKKVIVHGNWIGKYVVVQVPAPLFFNVDYVIRKHFILASLSLLFAVGIILIDIRIIKNRLVKSKEIKEN